MEPRLKTSKKWTALPKELIEQIRGVFKENFKQETKGSTIELEGRIYPEELLFFIGVHEGKRLKQNNFEISIPYKQNKDNVMKLVHLGMDAAAALFTQLFENEDDDEFPRIWQEVQFEGRQIFVQYTTVNSELEKEANRILGLPVEDEGGLAGGDWDEDSETPKSIKARLGIDDDSDPEDDGSSTH